MKISRTSDILIIGQHLTSRTEAVRDYLLDRSRSVSIIGLGSAFIDKKENRLFYYENGVLQKERVFKHTFLKKIKVRPFLFSITFFIYFIDIVRSLLAFKKRFDIVIGISHFPGLLGVLLKFTGVCKKCVYYAIDYYAPLKEAGIFDRALTKLEAWIDKVTVLRSDEVWDISERIPEGRRRFSNISKAIYADKQHIVPLGYAPSFFRDKGINKVDRYSIVFAGVIMRNQGLELILEALPELIKVMPKINIKIIGTGPFLPRFKEMVKDKCFESYFRFYGFVESVEEMLDIIASSAVGVSLWDDRGDRIPNAHYGDPGKTKLYSVSGLPVVVGDLTLYSRTLTDTQAGIAIKYDPKEFISALSSILLDDKSYSKYKANAVITANEHCNAEKIFSNVLN